MVGKASVNIQRSVRLTSDFQPFSSLHRALLGIFFTLAAAAAPFAFVICADGPRTENAERFSLIFRSSPTPTPLHRLRNYPFNLTQKSRTNSSDISSGDEAIFLTPSLQLISARHSLAPPETNWRDLFYVSTGVTYTSARRGIKGTITATQEGNDHQRRRNETNCCRPYVTIR